MNDGVWVHDDGHLQATFTQEELERLVAYEPRSDEEIRQIAHGIRDGEIFCSDQCHPEDLPRVFMTFGLMGPKNAIELKIRDITLVYESLSAAGPHAINGMPMFFSLRLMNRDEHRKLTAELTSLGVSNEQVDSDPYP